jgi:predicted nucleic acid-binding protein
MLYLDSSVLVCLFSSEDRTHAIQAWREELRCEDMRMSEWNVTEFYSAMSFKRRTAQMSVEQRHHAEALFRNYLKNYPAVLAVSTANFRRAATIAGRDDINIRAADALHLAIAEKYRAKLCTLDKKMHEAAGTLEIDCLVP